MKVIVIGAEQFLAELGAPPTPELIRLITQTTSKDIHIAIMQPIGYSKGLGEKLAEWRLEDYCGVFKQRRPFAQISPAFDDQYALKEHLILKFKSGVPEFVQFVEIVQDQLLQDVLKEALTDQLSGWQKLSLSSSTIPYEGTECISHAGGARFAWNGQDFKDIFPSSARPPFNWKKYRQELVIFCLSLLFAIIMAVSVGLSSSMGKAFALAFGMSHLGAAALAVSTAFLMLAFCLALTLLMYAAVYVGHKRNELSCCRALDQSLKDQAGSTPTSSLQFATSLAKDSPADSVTVSLPATSPQSALTEALSVESLSLV